MEKERAGYSASFPRGFGDSTLHNSGRDPGCTFYDTDRRCGSLPVQDWEFLAPRLATFNQHWLDKYQSVNNVPIVPLCHQNIALAMDGHKRPIPRPEVSSP